MKIIYLFLGLAIGGILGFFITRSLNETDSVRTGNTAAETTPANWKWADSLDAVATAPESHKIVFEDSTVRILQVVLEPNKTEPVHTHKWKSVMWFTQATPMTYYKWDPDGTPARATDSISIPQMPAAALNHGQFLDPEAPHAIRNLGNQAGIAYRIEFKKDFKN